MTQYSFITLEPQEYIGNPNINQLIRKKIGIFDENRYIDIDSESIDARRSIKYILRIAISDENPFNKYTFQSLKQADERKKVIIVGSGPCGLFAAIKLLQHGIKPIIIERGKKIEQRKKDTAKTLKNQEVDENSNFCFGEGGAGTFSDGKLYTRSNKKGNIDEFLGMLIHFGADSSIRYKKHAHIGTDCLSRIIKNIRTEIEKYGGEYRFSTTVTDFIVKDNTVLGVVTNDKEKIFADNVILATGHSATDIYELFYNRNWKIESKPFAMGVRVEHPQELINQIQYGNYKYKHILPAAEYSLKTNYKDRGVYSFCMCPGGIVVPTPHKQGIMVVNGMSNSARSGKFANSAIVVSIKQEDAIEFEQYKELSLLKFQQSLEKKMYYSNCICPAQKITDFLINKTSSVIAKSSYMPDLIADNLQDRLPKFITDALKIGFNKFDKQLKGFITNECNLIGLESRTSSAVRIVRNKDTMEHIQLKNLYPCGEGAGYAGGITSSAVDGINAALQICYLMNS